MEHNKRPEWYSKNVPPEHHHPHNEWLVDRCADRCDDQLPLFSQVGRGLRGNGFKVVCHEEGNDTTYLEGLNYDAVTGEYTTEWTTHNIEGGHLSYQYHLHPYGEPPTFTITFTYDRPDHPEQEWTWTTPAIPYILDAGGSGIGNLFIKPTTGATWTAVRNAVASSDLPDSIADTLAAYEKLVFPEDETRDVLQPPLPGDDWTVNLTYGKGGDIDCPTTDQEQADLDDLEQHFHDDLGYGDSGAWPEGLKGDGETGDRNTVWKWIKWITDKLGFDTTYNIGSNTIKKYIDDSIPSVKAGTGISVNKSGTEYTVSHNLAGSTNVTLTPGQNGQLVISATDTNTVTTVAAGTDITVTDSGTGGNHAYTISTGVKKWITDKLGFGDSVNAFDGLSGVDTVKKYIKKLISNIKIDVSNPKRYSVSQNVTFVLYALPETGITADTTLGISGADLPAVPNTPYNSPAGAPNTIDGQLVISYFDVLPEVSIDFVFNTATASTNFALVPAGHLLVACARGTRTPLNLASITLPNRDPQETGTPEKLKKPTATAETLINVGYYPDDYYGNSGTFQVYAGVGNVIAKSINVGSTRYKGWPWSGKTPNNNGAFFAYLMNRYTNGDVNTVVQIDYARNYFISYLQADPVS